MTAKKAWEAIVLHCRFLGIPVRHDTDEQIGVLNGHAIKILGSTSQHLAWESNFCGAFSITLFFPEEKITWNRVGILLHEIGHVLDFRDNLVILDRSILQHEKAANKYAMKVSKLLQLPEDKIKHHLDSILENYRSEFGKEVHSVLAFAEQP